MCENFATLIDDKELILYFTNFLTEDSYLVILGGKKFLFTDMRYYEDAVKLKGVECKLNEEISVCEFLKQNGVKGCLIDFTIENNKQVENVLNAFIKKIKGEDVQLIIDDVTYGHFNEGVL